MVMVMVMVSHMDGTIDDRATAHSSPHQPTSTNARSITGQFLYPAYATYKSLGRRPTDHAELERWLMFWSVVGAWTAAEGIVGWFLEW